MKKDKRRDESDHTFVDVKPTCFGRAEKPLESPADNLVEWWLERRPRDDFHPGYAVETSVLQL